MSTQTIPSEIKTPRKGSKLDKLVGMLSRNTGTTITKASKALGWQLHTTRASLTGLKKRGYIIERKDRIGKDSLYSIAKPDA